MGLDSHHGMDKAAEEILLSNEQWLYMLRHASNASVKRVGRGFESLQRHGRLDYIQPYNTGLLFLGDPEVAIWQWKRLKGTVVKEFLPHGADIVVPDNEESE